MGQGRVCQQTSRPPAARREFGALDILINNAAVCFNDPTLYGAREHTPFEAQASITMRVNFFGSLAVIREFLPLLRASPSPRLITFGSSAGRLSILRSQAKVELFTSPSLSVAQLEEQMGAFVAAVEAGVHAEHGWPNTCCERTTHKIDAVVFRLIA